MRTVRVGVAASPFPAQRCNDEDTRTKGLSLRDLHPQIDRAYPRSAGKVLRYLGGMIEEDGAWAIERWTAPVAAAVT